MGRGLVIICVGMVFIFGMIQLGISNRHNSETDINIQYASWVQARNVAASGAEVGVMELINDKTWRPVNGLLQLNLGESTADVTVTDHTTDATLASNQVRVVSVANIGGRTSTVSALMQERNRFPDIEGAMGIYSPDVKFRANGTAFLVSGADGQTEEENMKYGIAAGNSTVYNKVMDELSKNQEVRVQGKGGSPSVAEVADRNAELTELINWYYEIANTTSQGTVYNNLSVTGGEQLGTIENPQITYVHNSMKVSGNASGAGILIVGPDGDLDMTGGGNRNFNFHGLIIVMGKARVQGNMDIQGAMLFGGSEPEIEITIGGNIEIKYSKEALAPIDPFLSGSTVPINLPFRMISMYE